MEEFYNFLFGNHGYKHIGIVDVEKKIWGYEKDGIYHFCKEDLTEIDRKDIGIGNGVLVFTEVKESSNTIHKLLLDRQSFSNYFIIDSTNKVLDSHDGSRNCQLWRIDSTSIVVGEEYKSSFRNETHQSVIINGKSEYDYVFTKEINHLFFFSKIKDYFDDVIEGPEEKIYFHIYSNLQCIEEEAECAFVWKHKNGNAHFLYLKKDNENNEKLEIICSNSSDICTKTIDNSCLQGNSLELFKTKLFDDDYLIIPFEGNYGIIVLCAGEQYYNISTKIIDFKHYGFAPHGFSDKIISRKIGETTMGNYNVDGLEFYDVYGNCLELLNDPLKSNDRYFVFSIPNKSYFHNIDKLYGVLEIESHKCERVIIPPFFEHIEDLGYGLFNVQYGDYLEGKHIQHAYIFSSKEGIINGSPLDLNFNIRGLKPYNTIKSKLLVPYKENENIGLIHKGCKIIEAHLDKVQGFNYIFSQDHMTESYHNLIESYIPNCAIIQKDGKYGLVIGEYYTYIGVNVLKPKYDNIECVLVTSEGSSIPYTYFTLEKDNHFSIISDYNLLFNELCLEEYDRIEAVKWCHWLATFKVYRNGKVGAICSSNKNGLYIIPIKYNKFQIIWIGRNNHYLYCGDGTYYVTDEKAILSEDDYSFVSTDYYYVFRNNKTGKYIFINLIGQQVETSKIDDNENLLLVNGCYKFDIEKGAFLHEEDNDDSNSNYYHDDDNWDYERDTYYALGGSDYDQFKEEGGDIDSMMDGLGY